MGRKKKLPPQVDLICEWNGCDNHKHQNVSDFLAHLQAHCDQAIKDCKSENELCCEWFGCGEASFETSVTFKVHISFHGFHTKLMGYGYVEIKNLNEETGQDITCSLDGSTRTMLPPLPDIFVCCWNDCLALFIQAEEFYRHVEQHPFESNTVSKRRLSEEGSSSMNPEPPLSCLWGDCSFGPDTKSHIKEHLKSHTQEKIIACPHCGALFSHRNKFRDHLFRQLDNNDSNCQAIALDINEDQEIVNVRLLPTNSYKCDECDKKFQSISLLKEHNRKHYHYYKCDECGMTTSSPSTLKHHKKYRHSEERPYSCVLCSVKFKTRSDLRKHLDIHNEDSPAKCNLCDFECRSTHTLSSHMRQYHQDTANVYLCHECDRRFTRGNNLTRHLLSIHSYSLKPGQSRFKYVRDDDGIFRLSQ